MALPDYSSSGSGSMFASVQNANQQSKNKNTGPGGGRDTKKLNYNVPAAPEFNKRFNPNPNQISGLDSITPLGSAFSVPLKQEQGFQGSSGSGTPSPGSSPGDFGYPDIPLNQGPFTFGSQNLTNPFYDQNATYIPQGYRGATPNWMSSAGDPNPVTPGNQFAEEDPEAYYYALLNQKGLGGLDARSRAAQSMYSDFARGYQAAKFSNPNLLWAQFASQQDIPGLISQLSDEQIGIDRGKQAGPLNWTLRG